MQIMAKSKAIQMFRAPPPSRWSNKKYTRKPPSSLASVNNIYTANYMNSIFPCIPFWLTQHDDGLGATVPKVYISEMF